MIKRLSIVHFSSLDALGPISLRNGVTPQAHPIQALVPFICMYKFHPAGFEGCLTPEGREIHARWGDPAYMKGC